MAALPRRSLLGVALLLAGCGGEPAGDSFEHRSRAVGETLEHRVLVPEERAARPPLLVFLHGRGGGPESTVSEELEDALADAGRRAPIVLLPDGGEASYWHNRRDGAWARMVVREAIPAAIERLGADPDRVAIGGISMGGFGALHLAAESPLAFCSVAAHSPAVFAKRPRAGSPFAGAFDDARDFERNDLIERARRIPPGTWVDIGDDDQFAPAVRKLVARMREPRYREWDGGHDFTFFTKETRTWLRFHVERCS